MKIKMILLKEAHSSTTTTTEIFKCYKNCTLSDAQNAGNSISELLDFKFIWGGGEGHAPRLSRGKGPCGTLSGHRRLLHLQWPPVTKVIETPASIT